MKKVIYTAIFGDYDILREPEFINKDFDYVCFTDCNITSDLWRIEKTDKVDNPTLFARMYKTLPHKFLKEYDLSIWVDGSIRIVSDMNIYLKRLGDNDIMMFDHGRRCIYDEAKACIRHGKDDKDVIEKQMIRYAKEEFPREMGLNATGLMTRKHNDKVKEFCDAWWNEIAKGSIRDQLSFNYVMWKHPIDMAVLTWHVDMKKYFRIEGHEKRHTVNNI